MKYNTEYEEYAGPVAVASLEDLSVLGFLRAEAGNDSFYRSLIDQYDRKGYLSEKQLAAVRKSMPRSAPRMDLTALREKFDNAHANGRKRPKLRIGKYVFSRAPDHGRNSGSIYFTEGETYLGKISVNGKFQSSGECTPEDTEALRRISLNPLDAAIAYGRETGTCSCCGRELTNAKSIELGIGPVCLTNWGL